jgi:hypothetical protein
VSGTAVAPVSITLKRFLISSRAPQHAQTCGMRMAGRLAGDAWLINVHARCADGGSNS